MRRFERRLQAPSTTGEIVGADRLLDVSFSSELPVERYFGFEVLSHAPGAADLSRIDSGDAPLLWNHDPDQIIGTVESARIVGKQGRAVIRFAKTPAAQEIVDMVNDQVVKSVSFAYTATQYKSVAQSGPDGDDDPDDETYIASAWTVYEISLVSIPADNTVGVGRSMKNGSIEIMEQENQLSRTHRVSDRRKAEIEAGIERGLDAQREAEAARIAEITAMGKKYNMRDTDTFIREGYSIAEVRGIVLERMTASPAQPVANFSHQDIGLTDKESRSFSLLRAVRAISEGRPQDAAFEIEASAAAYQAAGRNRPSDKSIMVPTDVLRGGWAGPQTRATYQVVTAGAGTTGGTLAATNLLAGEFVEVLRNKSVTARLGARMLPGLTGNVDIPRQTAQTQGYWVAESGAITESEASFDKVSLRPRTVGSLSTISRLMLMQSTPAIEQVVREDLIRVMALAVDLAAISGSGTSGQPTGIYNTAGINSVVGGTNGANISFDFLMAMRGALDIANAPEENRGFAMNPHVFNYLSNLKTSTGSYLWMPVTGIAGAPGPTVLALPYFVSNQLRSTLTKGTSAGVCSEVYFGSWQELFIGMWGGPEIVVNPYDSTGFTTGDVKIRVMQSVDIGVRHSASFAVMSDALTPGF